MPLITAQNVCVAYPSAQISVTNLFKAKTPDKYAISDISFELDPGERLALVGLNGSGKSTLLRTIAGIYPPKSGSVHVNGTVASIFNLGIGMRMDLSGRKNIILQGMVNGQSVQHIKSLIPEIIEFSELGAVIDQPIHTYSQGMAMRLSFGIATAIKPDILLLDEWIGAGDRVFRMKAQQRLEAMVEDARGFVLASHNTEIVRRYCTKAIWLDKGRIKEQGDVETVLQAFSNDGKT